MKDEIYETWKCPECGETLPSIYPYKPGEKMDNGLPFVPAVAVFFHKKGHQHARRKHLK